MTSTSRTGRSALARWVLLLALTAGMVLMHHVPGGHGQHHPAAAATAPATSDHGQHQSAHEAPPTAEQAQHNTDQPGPVQLDDLLHLCLAIIAGAALLLLNRLRNRGALPGIPAVRFSPPLPRARRRRPPPTRRRLAELCVLRL